MKIQLRSLFMLFAMAFSFSCFSFAASPPQSVKVSKTSIVSVQNANHTAAADCGIFPQVFHDNFAVISGGGKREEYFNNAHCRFALTVAINQKVRPKSFYDSPPNLRRFNGFGFDNQARGKI